MRAALALLLSLFPAAAATIDIVNQVSEASYTSYLFGAGMLYAHDGNNRDAPGGLNHDDAADAIAASFTSFGLTTSTQTFSTGANIIGLLEGTDPTAGYYVLGAHYDSVAAGPGADDNASGVASVLEAAQVLSQHTFRSSIYFIAFDREEDGLYGATAWSRDHAADDILGMISLDMIGYNPEGDRHDRANVFHYGSITTAQDALAGAFTLYASGIAVTTGVSGRSDHVPFANRGKPAALLIEGAMAPGAWDNPYYHRAGDSVDTAGYIDYAYATELTRAVVGYAADGAYEVPEPGTGALLIVVLVFGYRTIAARRPRPQA